jgi:hypothetical protein
VMVWPLFDSAHLPERLPLSESVLSNGGSMHAYIVVLLCLLVPIPFVLSVVRKDNQEKYGVGFIPLFRSKKNGTMPEMSKSAHKMLA